MNTTVRSATKDDFEFAFETKRVALGPHVVARWGWDEHLQRQIHQDRWSARPWFIVQDQGGVSIGTLSVQEHTDHLQFGEFYLLPQFQRQGIGSSLLRSVLDRADSLSLPVRLEYLKWNPVGSLYRRHAFNVVAENEIHFFLERKPHVR